jgi:hypothetical protein
MIGSIVSHRVVLEQQVVHTLLGIRFWDPVTDSVVREGLEVAAWPDAHPEAISRAFRSRSSVYAFRGLDGLRHLEYPDDGVDPWTARQERFIVQARDARRRYLPLVFAVNVPHRGIFPGKPLHSPLTPAAPGCWLFSAPTRRAAPSWGVVRAQLMETDSETPLRFAVVEVEVGEQSWFGISDDTGQAVVFFPLPDFTGLAGFTSPISAMPVQSWPVTVWVQHAEAEQQTPEGAIAPNIRSLFNQPRRDIRMSDGGAISDRLSTDLVFGEELVLSSGEESILWLEPFSSPP